tara:strand:+ start:375 stop:554 length:180 start_codon:yes stop_codon:yes gene_type:complete
MAELVSPCCGAEYNDDNEIFKCETCKNEFDEPELDYEFNEAVKEAIAEDREDEKRDLGL